MLWRVQWLRAEGHRMHVHAVVDGDLVSLCGQPSPRRQATRLTVEELPSELVCPGCVAIARELAAALEQLREVDRV